MKVSVLGFGTVGVGVYEMLSKAGGLAQGPVLVRTGKADAPFKRDSITDITGDMSVGAAAEAIGGVHPAYEYARAVISAGKHFVTSNKALAAEKGIELSRLAREHGVGFLFGAACGGAVPFLHNLSLARQSDRILNLGGILNGTTNYMLDAMQRLGLGYGEALKKAQDAGYAEADPKADVCGLDSLRKIVLACAAAYDMLPSQGLLNEGIESLTVKDAEHFMGKGYICRLIARGGRTGGGGIFAYVEPVLFKKGAPECCVLQNYNMAYYEGENSGRITFTGEGAGRYPTASAVLRDLSSIQSGRKYMLEENCRRVRAQNEMCAHRYYVRLPENMAGSLPKALCETEDGVLRAVTEPMPVAEMHGAAAKIRERGEDIFFAAIEE